MHFRRASLPPVVALVFFTLLVAFFFGFLFGGGFTGLSVYSPVVVSQPVGVVFYTSGVIPLALEDAPTSLSVSGVMHGGGSIFYESEGIRVLV